jgi:hypothetical protein
MNPASRNRGCLVGLAWGNAVGRDISKPVRDSMLAACSTRMNCSLKQVCFPIIRLARSGERVLSKLFQEHFSMSRFAAPGLLHCIGSVCIVLHRDLETVKCLIRSGSLLAAVGAACGILQ